MWRRTCIIDAGNWNNRTTVEDMDLSLRAHLRGWRFLFLDHVEVRERLARENLSCATVLRPRLLVPFGGTRTTPLAPQTCPYPGPQSASTTENPNPNLCPNPNPNPNLWRGEATCLPPPNTPLRI